jgi:hypothetical protein
VIGGPELGGNKDVFPLDSLGKRVGEAFANFILISVREG